VFFRVCFSAVVDGSDVDADVVDVSGTVVDEN